MVAFSPLDATSYSPRSKTKYISEEYTRPDHLVPLEEGNLGVDGMDGVCSFLQVVAGRWLVATSSGAGGTSETSGRAGATETWEWHFGFLHTQTWVQVFLWSAGHPLRS